MFDLKIGFKCNNNCIHCVVADKRSSGNLDIPHIVKIIQSIPSGETIQITGGEPTIFSFLPSVLEMCKQKGCNTLIQTNGTGFSDKNFFKKCLPYLDHVHIAIHSCSPEIHDKIVGTEGMWKKTIQGWENILEANICCTTQTVLSKYNIESLYDTFDFIQKKAPDTYMSMTYPHMLGNAYTYIDEVAFQYSDHKDIIQKTIKDFGSHIFTEAIPPCITHPYFPEESAEKEIMKGYTREGIDFSGGFSKKNYNQLDVKEKRKGPKCKECIYNNSCIGVWKEYIQYFKNNLDLYPIKEEECC